MDLKKRAVSAGIELSKYQENRLNLLGTEFLILSRNRNGLGFERIKKSIMRAWPHYVELLGNRVLDAVIVDFEAPFGGGPMGRPDRYIVGIYSSQKISDEFQDYINNVTDWGKYPNTFDYIQAHYSSFEDPIQAYTDEVVFHELGHLYFGFGYTLVKDFKNVSESWFALGIGIVYDRIIWSKFYSNHGPLIQSLIDKWENQYRENESVDQRLVMPNTKNDKTVGLNRVQVFGHGKSYVYLKALREEFSPTVFDGVINSLLENFYSQPIDYDSFLNQGQFPKDLIDRIEKKYSVR